MDLLDVKSHNLLVFVLILLVNNNISEREQSHQTISNGYSENPFFFSNSVDRRGPGKSVADTPDLTGSNQDCNSSSTLAIDANKLASAPK